MKRTLFFRTAPPMKERHPIIPSLRKIQEYLKDGQYDQAKMLLNSVIGRNTPVLDRRAPGRKTIGGIYENGVLKIGLAKCNVHEGDQFTKWEGREIALKHAESETLEVINVEDENKLTELFIEKAKTIAHG